VQPFAGSVTKIYLSGAFFSNVAYDFHHPDLGPNDFTSGWDLSSFPRDGVAVEFERFVGGPEPIQSGPDTPFPLSLENTPAVQSSSTPESGGQRSIDIVHDGSRYTLNVWFGAEASQADREIARLLVTTIAFSDAATPEPPSSNHDGAGVGDPAVDKIPFVQERIDAVGAQLAALDASTPEGKAKAAALQSRLIALQQTIDDLCALAGEPQGC
jgi:hypothetical protein